MLGKPTTINSRDATYIFQNGAVEIAMGDHNGNNDIIGRIMVQLRYPGSPKTESEACKLSDPLDGSKHTEPDRFEYRRRRLSIYMSGLNARKMVVLDFHDPKLDYDLKF